ncbi:MAG: gliding motility-associated C-terminal domain-containing protein [Chitinophagales bacterium]
MKKVLQTCLLSLYISLLHAQVNLVPNPSLEDYVDCPYSFDGFFGSETVFYIVDQWMRPSGGTSDLYNVCASSSSGMDVPDNFFGYQEAHTGDGYAGMYTYLEGYEYREYIQTRLTEVMVTGNCYYIEFYVNSADDFSLGYNYAIDEMGLHISDERYFEDFLYGPISLTPQITGEEGLFYTEADTWYKVSGFYEAAGGEEWITIGNFQDDDETELELVNPDESADYGYIFVDDVLVTEAGGADFLEDTVLCELYYILEAPTGAEYYLWSTGDTTQNITVTETGEYSVEIFTGCGGAVTDTAYIEFVTAALSTTSEEIEVCFNDFPYTISAPAGYASWLWNSGETTETISIDEPGTYIVSAFVDCGTLVDTIKVISIEPIIDLGNDTLICSEQPWNYQITANDGFSSYEWNTGESLQTITINEPGVYSVDGNSACGIISDEVIFTGNPFEGLSIDLGNDTALCFNFSSNSVTFTAPDGLPNYLWSTGSTGQSITVSESGTYWVVSENPLCDDLSDTVNVLTCNDAYLPNAFSPNGDGINDLLFIIGLQPGNLLAFEIYNRWGEKVFETNDVSTTWNGTFNNESLPMGVYVWNLRFYNGGTIFVKSGNVTLVR